MLKTKKIVSLNSKEAAKRDGKYQAGFKNCPEIVPLEIFLSVMQRAAKMLLLSTTVLLFFPLYMAFMLGLVFLLFTIFSTVSEEKYHSSTQISGPAQVPTYLASAYS